MERRHCQRFVMPELPEVETTRRGIEPHVQGQTVDRLDVRQKQLRWPISDSVNQACGQQIISVGRRAKYLLLQLENGCLLLHLGMSGSLRMVPASTPAGFHDHVDIVMQNDQALRFTDPRRFGALLWADSDGARHPLLSHLGPEPFAGELDTDYLWRRSRKRKLAVKNFIMDGRIVVGVGNIYASEALYRAGIHPNRQAGRISRQRYWKLQHDIRKVLGEAIDQGGTTLRDFNQSDGNPGYFKQRLNVYDRQGLPCYQCGELIRNRRIGQRASYYCYHCQR